MRGDKKCFTCQELCSGYQCRKCTMKRGEGTRRFSGHAKGIRAKPPALYAANRLPVSAQYPELTEQIAERVWKQIKKTKR
jgi:hypothetical protein